MQVPTRTLAIVGAAALLGGYVYSPYHALGSIGAAIERRDAAEIASRVDWRSVRNGLKEDLSAAMAPSLMAGSQGSIGGAAMGIALGNTLVAGMVDSVVTPGALAAALGDGFPRDMPGLGGGTLRRPSVPWAFFDGLATFKAVVRWKGMPEHVPGVEVRMELRGFGWQVTRVSLPEDLLKAAVAR